MSWLTDHPVLLWIGLALILAAIEVATLDLFFLMLATASAIAGAVAALGAPFPLQMIAAAGSAMALLLFLRPSLLRRISPGAASVTGTAALVGQLAHVTETVDAERGRVKLAGEIWSARTESDSHQLYEPGQSVRVKSIDGATAVVEADAPQEGK